MNKSEFPVPSAWYLLCRSSELKRKPKRLEFAGLALVAFRDEQGQVGVLLDRCAHRGVPLSQGRVCGKLVECPYHGWQYDREGNVAHIPALGDCSTAVIHQSIPSYFTHEQEGFIWIWQAPKLATAETATQPPQPPPVFSHFNTAGWTSFVMQTRFTGTVESCLENFLDCPHATFVHRYWFRAPTRTPIKALVRTLEDGAQAEFFEEPRKKSAVWWLLSPRNGTMTHTDRFISPNISRVDYAFPNGLHYIITSSCTPLNQHETLVFTVMTFRYKRIGWLVRLFFEPLSRWIIRQDVKMLALQKKNLDQFSHGSEQLFQSTPADLLGAHIISWRKAILNRTPPPVAGQENSVDFYL